MNLVNMHCSRYRVGLDHGVLLIDGLGNIMTNLLKKPTFCDRDLI